MFEKASRLKLRITTDAGNISVEDLWDLPLTSLNNISLDGLAKALNKSVKENAEESFVVAKSKTNSILDLSFDIVKHVIKVRLEEKAKAENAASVKAQKEKILEILEDKEDEALKGKSAAALKKMLKEL